MEKMIKRAGIALAAFGLASSAYAASFAPPECPCDITVPKYAGGFRIGIEGLYLSPTLADNDYVSRQLTGVFNGAGDYKSHTVDFDYQWGYKVDLAYLFPGTGNDVTIAWTDIEFDNSDSQTLITGGPDVGFGIATITFIPVTGFNPDATANTTDMTVSARYDVDYQAFDLELGQAMLFMDRVMMRFHAGIRYAELDTKLRINTVQEDPANAGNFFNLSQEGSSDWDGVGIRVGANGAWMIGSGFSLTGALSTSVLVGDAERSVSSVYTDDFTPANDVTQTLKVDFDNRVVPNVEARLGLNYKYVFTNQTELELEAGYQIANYFDVDHKLTGALSSGASDVGMHGGYLRLAVLV